MSRFEIGVQYRLRAAQVAAALIGAYMVYALTVGLETNGRHFVELAFVRVVLLGALATFAAWSGGGRSRLGRVAMVLAAGGVIGFALGAIGAVATDGWNTNPFDEDFEGSGWYAFVIGLSGIVFALGTTLVGIAGRSAGWLAIVTIVAGATFPAVFPLGDTWGHVAWLALWLILSLGLVRVLASPGPSLEPAEAR